MTYRCPQPTPMILSLNIHYSRAADLVRPDLIQTAPAVPLVAYRDLFGNCCSRIVAPKGRFLVSCDSLVNDSGVLVSFDSTMLSNLSVGMPIDLLCYERDSLAVTLKRRFDTGDPYFEALNQQWLTGTRRVFHQLPAMRW